MRLIDADALLETLARKYPEWYTEKPKDRLMHYAWLVYYWSVRDAPTIEAEPVRHGRWIEEQTVIKCSACGEEFNDEIVYMTYPYNNLRYCPNCGAKMYGEQIVCRGVKSVIYSRRR